MQKWSKPIVDAISKGDSLGAADLWLRSGFMAPAMENSELATRLTQLARANARVYEHRDLEVPLSPPAVDRLSEIRSPTLLLLGERDIQDEHRIVERIYREVPNSERVVFPGIGHVANLETPEEFNRVVLVFLRKHSIGTHAATPR